MDHRVPLFASVVGLVLVTSGPPASAANYTITRGRVEPDGREPALLGGQRRHGHGQPDAAGGSADALQDREPRARHAARARPRRPQRRHGHLQRSARARPLTTGRTSTSTWTRSSRRACARSMELELHAHGSGDRTATTSDPPNDITSTSSSSRPWSSTAWTSTARPTSGNGTGRCGTSPTTPGSGTGNDRAELLRALRRTRSTAPPPCCPTSSSAGRRRPSRARSPRSCSTARPRTSA